MRGDTLVAVKALDRYGLRVDSYRPGRVRLYSIYRTTVEAREVRLAYGLQAAALVAWADGYEAAQRAARRRRGRHPRLTPGWQGCRECQGMGCDDEGEPCAHCRF